MYNKEYYNEYYAAKWMKILEEESKIEVRLKSKEYIKWLLEYLVKNKEIRTYSYIQAEKQKTETETCIENMKLLYRFVEFIHILAHKQNVPVGKDLTSMYTTAIVYVQIRDKYMKFYTEEGLEIGWTSISLLEQAPNTKCVKFPC